MPAGRRRSQERTDRGENTWATIASTGARRRFGDLDSSRLAPGDAVALPSFYRPALRSWERRRPAGNQNRFSPRGEPRRPGTLGRCVPSPGCPSVCLVRPAPQRPARRSVSQRFQFTPPARTPLFSVSRLAASRSDSRPARPLAPRSSARGPPQRLAAVVLYSPGPDARPHADSRLRGWGGDLSRRGALAAIG
jgi:hypothetical protein